jgi:hypothetical protein
MWAEYIEHGLGKVLYDLTIAVIVGGLTGVVSGLYVDSKIRRREEKRWAATRNTYYLAILGIIDRLQYQAVPEVFRGKGGKICVFSQTAYVGLKFEPRNKQVFWSASDWLPIIKPLLEKTSAAKTLRSEPYLLMLPLTDALANLETLFRTYGPVADPELGKSLGEAIASAISFIDFDGMNVDWKDPDHWARYFWQMLVTLRLFNEVREKIIKKGRLSDRPPRYESKS